MNRVFVINSVLFSTYALIGMNTEDTTRTGSHAILSSFLQRPVVAASSQSSRGKECTSLGNSGSSHDPIIEKLLKYAEDNEVTAWPDGGDHEIIMRGCFEAELKKFSGEEKDAFAEMKRLLSKQDALGKQKLTMILLRLALRSARQLWETGNTETINLEKTIRRLNKEQKTAQKRYLDLENEVVNRDQRVKALEDELKKCQENAEQYRNQLDSVNEKYDTNHEFLVRELKGLRGGFDALHGAIAGSEKKEREENAS